MSFIKEHAFVLIIIAFCIGVFYGVIIAINRERT